MTKKTNPMSIARLAWAALLLALIPGTAPALDVYLRTQAVNLNMPDGAVIPMWGFARDTAFGSLDGAVTVPGPLLRVAPGDPVLNIFLDNNLTVPVSIVIPGQTAAMVPTYQAGGRMRAFTHETPPGNAAPVQYSWTGLKPGTYLYHSGSHIQVQIQMGLYGGVVKDLGAGLAYPGVAYDRDLVLHYSEIDPLLHQAVASNNYGPGKPMTSTMYYEPRYFLINGGAYPDPKVMLAGAASTERVLLRFLSSSIETHEPVLLGLHGLTVAEDGNPYAFAKPRYSIFLPAGKTTDVLLVNPPNGSYPIYDRRLDLVNHKATNGGMLTFLGVGAPCPVAPSPLVAPILVTKSGGGLLFAWTDQPDATSYVLHSDPAPSGAFTTQTAFANSGTSGITLAMPAGNAYYLLGGANCAGPGPIH